MTVEEKDFSNVNGIFKIPICYNDKVRKLDDNIIAELELTKCIIDDDSEPVYGDIFMPRSKPTLKIINQVAEYYTSDVDYLKQTQELIKIIKLDEINTIHNKYNFNNFELNDIVSSWEEIKGDTGFYEKYSYVDWSFAKHLNNNPYFLQIMSLYNITSPILSLCLPIFVLIIPFIIIKIKGIKLTIKQYVDILKTIVANHAIFKVFTEFHKVDSNQKMYLVLSSAFYIFSIYQNILTCIRFYSNLQKIHIYLDKFKKYVSYTLEVMDYYIFNTRELTKYGKFIDTLVFYKATLKELYNDLDIIKPFTFSFSKIQEIGHIMYCFYKIYDRKVYSDAIVYSFGFNGYFDILCNTKNLVNNSKLMKTSFTVKGKKPVFKKMYYPKFIRHPKEYSIKNDFNLDKNMIITGPNASGKTTTLKSAFINILLSQQIGYGCFEGLKLYPYDRLHCYLNIPDTSGRDSLFQAEARRCKEIIDCIDDECNKGQTHFCIFDELYSGTNPEEAVISANAFMDYIVKNENVTCMLTTHYVKLCKRLAKNSKIKNYHMKTLKKNDNNKFTYTYKLEKGISKIKGGLKVLHDMKYPKEILDLANM